LTSSILIFKELEQGIRYCNMLKKDQLNRVDAKYFLGKSHPVYSQSDNFFSFFWKLQQSEN